MTRATTLRGAAGFIDRTGFALLMPHQGLPLPSLFEAIRGRKGGHPFRPWTKDSDRMWEWKDALPAQRLAYYGAVWAGVPGFVSVELLPVLLRLRGTPPGAEGFREAYREGRLPFDVNRIAEVLLAKGALNTYRLRLAAGLTPAAFKRALTRLERGLFTARCGATTADTVWPAAIIDLTARVFPKAGGMAARLTSSAARAEAEARLAAVAPGLAPARVARLLAG